MILVLLYFLIFGIPIVGISLVAINLKNKKTLRALICGLFCTFYVLIIIFFPFYTFINREYSKSNSLLQYFEKNYADFEEYSFGKMIRQNQGISWCRLGKERLPNEKYKGFMTIELEYRSGTLFNVYPYTKFSNIIVYSEENLIEKNPRPKFFKKILKTSQDNWYYVYVSEDYEYF